MEKDRIKLLVDDLKRQIETCLNHIGNQPINSPYFCEFTDVERAGENFTEALESLSNKIEEND